MPVGLYSPSNSQGAACGDVAPPLLWPVVNYIAVMIMCRRADGALPNFNSRLCSCHFKDGMRENGPTLFKRNEQKAMQYSSPEKKVCFGYAFLFDYMIYVNLMKVYAFLTATEFQEVN